ncbi:MAG: nucleotidyl transferase AbiEii/AbiGii toxin family protein [Armatimonadetes bacterium]|nr:nucleotidyl transferase AbiEii/AbiGii toxin family protein [Armatimonadota bacterium]
MDRPQKTPAAFKQALERRLKNRSAETGTDFPRLRQLLVFERFLARVFEVFGERAIVKGGVVLELRLAAARATRDLDLHLSGSPQRTLAKLQQAGRLELGDQLVFEVIEDPEHPELRPEGVRYEGRRYRVEARLAGKVYGARFGVDVAFAEPVFGQPEELAGRAFGVLGFAGVRSSSFRVYPLELHLAEKLHTLPRPRPNSRVKDLPDIALLAGIRALDALELRRPLEWTSYPIGSLVMNRPRLGE